MGTSRLKMAQPADLAYAVTARDVGAPALIKAFSAHLKRQGKMTLPLRLGFLLHPRRCPGPPPVFVQQPGCGTLRYHFRWTATPWHSHEQVRQGLHRREPSCSPGACQDRYCEGGRQER